MLRYLHEWSLREATGWDIWNVRYLIIPCHRLANRLVSFGWSNCSVLLYTQGHWRFVGEAIQSIFVVKQAINNDCRITFECLNENALIVFLWTKFRGKNIREGAWDHATALGKKLAVKSLWVLDNAYLQIDEFLIINVIINFSKPWKLPETKRECEEPTNSIRSKVPKCLSCLKHEDFPRLRYCSMWAKNENVWKVANCPYPF